MDEMADRIHETVTPRPQPLRQRAMVADGRHADRMGLPVPGGRDRHPAGATTINIPDTVGYTAPREAPI
jgi:hypothetical protein